MDEITVTVVWNGNETAVSVRKGANLLMAMVQAGLPVSFVCTTGKCATCQLPMEIPTGSANAASETEMYRLGKDAIKQGIRLSCQVYVQGPLTVYLQ